MSVFLFILFIYLFIFCASRLFIEAGLTCLLPVIWCRFLDSFIVTPQKFTFSLEYVERRSRQVK